MLQLPAGYSEDKVIDIVKREYSSSIDATRAKREIFKKNMKLYLNTENRETKILSKYIRSTVQQLRAMHYIDEINVEFSGRQIGDETYAYNLNKLAKFDYEEMKLKEKRLRVHEDKFIYWVAIEAFVWWDNRRQCPVSITVDPMCWVPDLNHDQNYWPRFHWFEMMSSKYSLTEKEWYSSHKVADYLNRLEWDLIAWARNNEWDIRDIQMRFIWDCNVSIYHHYTIIWWEKYHITTSWDQNVIFRCIKLKASNKTEEDNPMLIEFPVATRNWISLRYDPFGVNIFDILADKQMGMQLFDNLARIQAEHEVFGHKFLVDEDAVQDISMLIQDTVWPSYVPAKFEQNKQPIIEVPRWQIASDAWNVRNSIQENAYNDIGMDARTLWVSTWGSLTATENQRVQANANLRIMVWLKEDLIGEEKFRKIWYSYYKLYFKSKWKKIFQLTNALWSDNFEISKSDFMTDNDIDVKIKLKSEIEADKQKKLTSFMAMYWTYIQDPNLWQTSKLYIQRYMLELQWFSKDQIKIIYPYTPEEEQARLDVELLNRNEEVWKIQDINEDHWAYLMIYDQAIDTEAKQKAIKARMKAYVLSGQSSKVQPQMWWQWDMQNMMVNQMMQQQPVQAEALPTNAM